MAGYSVNGYLNDFVLHGTSQPFSEFKDSLIMDLSNLIKVLIDKSKLIIYMLLLFL